MTAIMGSATRRGIGRKNGSAGVQAVFRPAADLAVAELVRGRFCGAAGREFVIGPCTARNR